MDRIERLFEGPLATYTAGLSLIAGALSTYGDIATHVDVGRVLATQMLDVGEDGAPGATHRERLTSGLDTLAANDPPVWLDVVAYGMAIALALIRAVMRSLNRLEARPMPGGTL